MAKPKQMDLSERQDLGKKIPRLGPEKLDPTPVAIPLRFTRQSSLNDVVRNMVRSEELRRLVEEAGEETFEEADDFDIGDDYDPQSPYEEIFEGDVLQDAFALKQMRDAELAAAGDKKPPPASPPIKPDRSPGPGDEPQDA